MDSSDDEYQIQSLPERSQRTTYLITYSQVDPTKFPTRVSFAHAVVDAFKHDSNLNVLQWACSKENHKKNGVHYHLAVKLSTKKRWKSIKSRLTDLYGIVVHFSANHDNYYTAYKYVVKEDSDFATSIGHPDLSEIGSPRTSKCVRAQRSKRKSNDLNQPCSSNSTTPSCKLSKPQRLTPLDVAVLICDRGFRNPVELRQLAEEQRREGKKDLAEFCVNRTNQRLEDLFESAWGLRDADSKLEKQMRRRIDIIREAATETCSSWCEGKWLTMALEVLKVNQINSFVFAHDVRELLSKGRGKNMNIMLIGPSNSAKSFMFAPLEKLFDCFTNPASNKYAWVGVDQKEIILLQDFSFDSNLISWKSLLLLLEGQKLYLPAPRNHFAKDVEVDTDIPIFATSGEKIIFYNRFNAIDQRETAMMDSRWKYIEFTHVFPVEKQVRIEPCRVCFSKLVLRGEDCA